jgi:hypothetical protein
MTSGDYPAGTGAWAPVIFFRTHRVDMWWRVRPADVSPDGTVAAIIAGAIGSGRFPAPRFVLARLDAGTLAGVACAASQFGTEYAADSQGRPLYGFIGWRCADPRAQVPAFDEFTSGWELLVRRAYDPVMATVWLASAQEAREPVAAEPGPAPWPAPGGPRLRDLPADLADVAAPDGGTVRVYPSASAPLVWQAVADYGARAALVTGWATYQSAIQPALTHVCANGVSGPFPMSAPSPARASRPAGGPAPGEQAATAGYRPADQPAGVGHQPAGLGYQPAGVGYQPAGLGYQPAGVGHQSAGPAAEPAAGLRPDADREAGGSGGSGGRMLGRLRDLGDGVIKAVTEAVSAGDDGVPPAPPDWSGGWTFHPPKTFLAEDRHYVYWHALDDPVIHCMDQRVRQWLDWTGSGWLVSEAGQRASTAADQPQASPGAAGHDNAPGQPERQAPAGSAHAQPPTAPDLRTVTPQPLSDAKRQKMNTAFGGFGRPTRDRDAAPGTDETPGRGEERE